MKRIIKAARLITLCCILAATITFAEEKALGKEPNKPNLDPNHEVIKTGMAKLIRSTLGEPNEPSYAKLIPAEKLKEDLDFLFKTIEEVHPNMYAYTSKEEFAPLRDNLYKQINHSMTRLEFYKAVAPVVASLKNGHTYIEPFKDELKQFMEKGGSVFPLALHWDGSKLIVVKNYTSVSLPIGGSLLSINGEQADKIFERFGHYFPTENRNENPQQVEKPMLFGWLLRLEYGPVEEWTVEIKATDGTIDRYIVKSVLLSTVNEAPPGAIGGKENNQYKYIVEYDTALLKIDSFGSDLGKFKSFLQESFQKIHEQKVSNLVIDIRENPGGSDRNSGVLVEYLTAKPYSQFEEARIKWSSQDEKELAPLRQQQPQLFKDKKVGDIITFELPLKRLPDNPLRFNGKIFVLIGPRSFSTSTSFAAVIKRFSIGKLVGSETGDPTVLYGNVINAKMPNSGLMMGVAGRAFVLAGGKEDGHGVIPDYEVKQTPEDIAKGVDTVLQFTLDLIKKSVSETSSEHKADNPVQTERAEK